MAIISQQTARQANDRLAQQFDVLHGLKPSLADAWLRHHMPATVNDRTLEPMVATAMRNRQYALVRDLARHQTQVDQRHATSPPIAAAYAVLASGIVPDGEIVNELITRANLDLPRAQRANTKEMHAARKFAQYIESIVWLSLESEHRVSTGMMIQFIEKLAEMPGGTDALLKPERDGQLLAKVARVMLRQGEDIERVRELQSYLPMLSLADAKAAIDMAEQAASSSHFQQSPTDAFVTQMLDSTDLQDANALWATFMSSFDSRSSQSKASTDALLEMAAHLQHLGANDQAISTAMVPFLDGMNRSLGLEPRHDLASTLIAIRLGHKDQAHDLLDGFYAIVPANTLRTRLPLLIRTELLAGRAEIAQEHMNILKDSLNSPRTHVSDRTKILMECAACEATMSHFGLDELIRSGDLQWDPSMAPDRVASSDAEPSSASADLVRSLTRDRLLAEATAMSSVHSIFSVTYRDTEGTPHPLFTNANQQTQRVLLNPSGMPFPRRIAEFISSDPGSDLMALNIIMRERLFSDIERLAGDVTAALTQHGRAKAMKNLDSLRIALIPADERSGKSGSNWYYYPINEALRQASDAERQGNQGLYIITPK